jgi:hypothetical protein
MEPIEPPKSNENAQLAEILYYLKLLYKKDRLHRRLGYIGSFIKMIPILFSIYFMIYVYFQGEKVLSTIIDTITEKTTSTFTTKQRSLLENISSDAITEEVQKLLKR